MRFSTIAVVGFVGISTATVVAQTPAQIAAKIPVCVLPCDVPAISAVGCGQTDYACHCQRSAQLEDLILPCLKRSSNCTAAELQTLGVLLPQICAAVNATTNTTATVASTAVPRPTGSVAVSPIPYSGTGLKLDSGDSGVLMIGAAALASWLL